MSQKYTKNVTKLGNSFYVNIPIWVLKELNIKDGDVVDVILDLNKKDVE